MPRYLGFKIGDDGLTWFERWRYAYKYRRGVGSAGTKADLHMLKRVTKERLDNGTK